MPTPITFLSRFNDKSTLLGPRSKDGEGALALGLLIMLVLGMTTSLRPLASPDANHKVMVARHDPATQVGECHRVGISPHDLGSVARRKGLAELEGAVQLQAQSICDFQVLSDLHLLRLYTIKSQQSDEDAEGSKEMSKSRGKSEEIG